MNRMARTTLAAACAMAIFAPCGAQAAEASPASPGSIPTAAFFKPERFTAPVMSPDGTALAALAENAKGRHQLAIIDTADLHNIKAIATFDNVDIYWVMWLDSKRLMFAVTDEQASAWDRDNGGLFAIDRDGQNGMIFGGRVVASAFARPRDGLGSVDRVIADGSGDVVTSLWKWKHLEWSDSYPERYDTRKGRKTPLLTGQIPTGVQEWFTDEQGKVRAAEGVRDAQAFMLVAQPDGTWAERARFPLYGGGTDGVNLLRIATDGQAYATRTLADATGSRAVFRFDLDTGKTDAQPLLSAPGFDLAPQLIENSTTHKVIGARIDTDAPTTVWFDPDMKALQAKVDAALPGMVNRIDVGACGCAKRALVTSGSDQQPPKYYLFDRASGELIAIGSARPEIQARQMAMTDFYRIKARDGMEIPVYVTKPRGKGPFPTVVLVHGGPYMRGWDWLWDPESQFLASRGYLVVKPEFRGSTGYGDKLFRAGFKEWGLKMQDDIADATRWAATQGMADADRTCIAGGSYGGYATLMGLVRYPELYRCGVAEAAVTDINLMFDITWSDASDQYKKFGMPILIGDQEKDAAQLKQTSPIQQAARINRPLLLAHGGVDPRVPVDHAIKLKRALEAHGAPVTWIEYAHEAHGWYDPANRIDYYDRVAKFLDANIGPDAKH